MMEGTSRAKRDKKGLQLQLLPGEPKEEGAGIRLRRWNLQKKRFLANLCSTPEAQGRDNAWIEQKVLEELARYRSARHAKNIPTGTKFNVSLPTKLPWPAAANKHRQTRAKRNRESSSSSDSDSSSSSSGGSGTARGAMSAADTKRQRGVGLVEEAVRYLESLQWVVEEDCPDGTPFINQALLNLREARNCFR